MPAWWNTGKILRSNSVDLTFKMNFSIQEAVELTSYNASRYIGNLNIGEIKTGFSSNFLVLDKKFNLIDVYLEGNKVNE